MVDATVIFSELSMMLKVSSPVPPTMVPPPYWSLSWVASEEAVRVWPYAVVCSHALGDALVAIA